MNRRRSNKWNATSPPIPPAIVPQSTTAIVVLLLAVFSTHWLSLLYASAFPEVLVDRTRGLLVAPLSSVSGRLAFLVHCTKNHRHPRRSVVRCSSASNTHQVGNNGNDNDDDDNDNDNEEQYRLLGKNAAVRTDDLKQKEVQDVGRGPSSSQTPRLGKEEDSTNTNNGRRSGNYSSREKTRWIIVVDDEEAIRNSVSQFLQSSNPQLYRITPCDSAMSVLDLLLRQGPTSPALTVPSPEDTPSLPDVIVADIRMPNMTGIDLLYELRSNPMWTTIPVVLLTAKTQLKDRLKGYEAGADAYLPKPFDPSELLAIVEALIVRHDRLNDNQVSLPTLQRELHEIKQLLKRGGAGIGNGFVENTGIFLAPDERRVLELLCAGNTNKEMATQLFWSTRRVEQILTSLFRKVNVKNRTELVRWAISTGQVEV